MVWNYELFFTKYTLYSSFDTLFRFRIQIYQWSFIPFSKYFVMIVIIWLLFEILEKEMFFSAKNMALLSCKSNIVFPRNSSRSWIQNNFTFSPILLSWLHLKVIRVNIAAWLRATCALLFWPTWLAAADRTLLLDERSFKLDS